MSHLKTHGLIVKGSIDGETRCKHYHNENDRIAIKFFCCGEYYPCFECHAEHGCGQKEVWPKDQFDKKAVLCGSCGVELTVTEYLSSDYACPACSKKFNPGCSLHRHLYFQR